LLLQLLHTLTVWGLLGSSAQEVGVERKTWRIYQNLLEASIHGDVAGVRRLVAAGADVDRPCAWSNMEPCLEELACACCPWTWRCDLAARPLHWAADRGHHDTVRLLAELGADKNAKAADGSMPAHWAATAGRAEVMKVLLRLGADMGVRDPDGQTPLQLSVHHGHHQVAQLLREAAERMAPAIEAMGVKELKSYLGKRGVHLAGCCEKSELMALALGTLPEATLSKGGGGGAPLTNAGAAASAAGSSSSHGRPSEVAEGSEPNELTASQKKRLKKKAAAERKKAEAAEATATEAESEEEEEVELFEAETRLSMEEEAAALSLRLKEVQKRVQKLGGSSVGPPAAPQDAETLCVLCLDAPKDHIITPCGHQCVCGVCAEKLKRVKRPTCPICREPIAATFKVFVA
jgi:hypothetical protein